MTALDHLAAAYSGGFAPTAGRHEVGPLPAGEGKGPGLDLTLRESTGTIFDDETPSEIDPAPNTTLPPAFP